MQIRWIVKPFETLTNYELYDVLQLRNEVFVVEQNCVYQDCDEKDKNSIHILGYINNDLACTARLLPISISYTDYFSIGRVVTKQKYRGKNIGKTLMEKAINELYNTWGKVNIKIGAQAYLKKFYESFGFEDKNEPYIEDGIPHLIMIKDIA